MVDFEVQSAPGLFLYILLHSRLRVREISIRAQNVRCSKSLCLEANLVTPTLKQASFYESKLKQASALIKSLSLIE